MASLAHVAFRVFYTALYILFLLFLLALVLITPIDQIYQTIDHGRIGNVFVIGGAYVLTGLFAAFIYFSRIYTNRTYLAAIPRPYLPIAEQEISHKVFRIIVKNRQRSALVAWDARPRDLRQESYGQTTLRPIVSNDRKKDDHVKYLALKPKSHRRSTIPPLDVDNPPWGHIVHPGWSSPSAHDMPSLQFAAVITELPNLLEAKAASCAPPDPAFRFMAGAPGAVPPPDARAVALLQRQASMGMREYIAHLVEIGAVDTDRGFETLAASFLDQYEYARFSVEALTEGEFRQLMAVFAQVLARVTPQDKHDDAGRSPRSGPWLEVPGAASRSASQSPQLPHPLAEAWAPAREHGLGIRGGGGGGDDNESISDTGSVIHSRAAR